MPDAVGSVVNSEEIDMAAFRGVPYYSQRGAQRHYLFFYGGRRWDRRVRKFRRMDCMTRIVS
jgi:hypothetical protein